MSFSINTTQEDIRLYAAYDTAKKIALENKFIPELRKFYTNMARDFETLYAATGETLSAFSYQSDLEELLQKHYRRVSRVFSNRLGRALFKQYGEEYEIKQNTNDEVQANIDKYIESQSINSAEQISQTNNDNIKKALAAVIANRVLSPDATPQEERKIVAPEVSVRIAADGYARSDTIAITETQNLAEYSKHQEYLVETLNLTPLQLANTLERIWVTVLDEKTRFTHVLADGQIVGVDEPFLVDGESLRYPGDPDGSPGNVINCRCASVPRIQ